MAICENKDRDREILAAIRGMFTGLFPLQPNMVRDRLAEEHKIVLQPLDFYEYMYHLEQIGDLEYLRVAVTDRNGSYEVGYYRRPDLRR